MPHKHIDAPSFKEKMQNEEFIVIDVRTPDENKDKRITDSIVIDFHHPTFFEEINKLDRDKTYLVYCRSGNRSGQAMDIMKNMDFVEVYNLEGGIIAWEANNFEFIK